MQPMYFMLQDLVSSHHRAEMCKLAIQHSNWLRVDLWEIQQDSWTPTAKVYKYQVYF